MSGRISMILWGVILGVLLASSAGAEHVHHTEAGWIELRGEPVETSHTLALDQLAASEEAVQQLAEERGWVWWRDPRPYMGKPGIVLGDKKSYESVSCWHPPQHVYRPRQLSLEAATLLIQAELSPRGSLVGDKRTGKIIVSDEPANTARIRHRMAEAEGGR